jgi:outer membrane receptor protein involved in Fe transport
MKSETSTAPRTKKYLVSCLAALMAVSAPMGFAADNDALKKLQDENAALSKRHAALEGSSTQAAAPAAAAPAAAAGTAAKGSTMQADAGVQSLSAFEVKSDKDQGYLRTNSVTATRINMAIQNIPMSVSVMSKEFLDDANIRSITDVLRYTSSGAGDNNFAMRRPSNSATPQGGFTLRGFGVNSLLRNGISRYIGYNVNNVDRIEIVKGPASVFFGAGYPGGVINYITKQPVFGKIPTTLSYTFGDNNMNRVVLDNNTQLSKKAAMRVVGSWENRKGFRNYEFKKENSITANLTLVPFDSGKVKITFEFEHLDGTYNDNQKDWLYPDGWFQAYAEPSAALISAAGLSTNANPVAAYRARIFAAPGTYIADVRNAAGNQALPLYTKIVDGAYYTDKSGCYYCLNSRCCCCDVSLSRC